MSISKRTILTIILSIILFTPSLFGDDGWKQIGPKGGPISSIISVKGEKLIIGAGGSGIYISEGESVSVKPAKGSENSYILCFTSHPTNKNIIFAGAVLDKILVSRDGGRTWNKSAKGIKNFSVDKIVFDPTNSRIGKKF